MVEEQQADINRSKKDNAYIINFCLQFWNPYVSGKFSTKILSKWKADYSAVCIKGQRIHKACGDMITEIRYREIK